MKILNHTNSALVRRLVAKKKCTISLTLYSGWLQITRIIGYYLIIINLIIQIKNFQTNF